MRFRKVVLVVLSAALALGTMLPPASAQQSQLSATQRLDIMRSRLDTMRRTLNSAIAGLNSQDTGQKPSADDPRERLAGLEKEAGKLIGSVADLQGKVERSERFDASQLDKLESAVADLDTRVQASMRDTARDRNAALTAAQQAAPKETAKKKGGGFFSHIIPFRGGGGSKYDELVATVGPGRDHELFEVATKEARHDNYEEARSLYAVIINTYPDSTYLPLAKLAIADTFYLEGTTSALIQAGQAYQDWMTFFPTHALSDDVCLKMGEVEMRRMGLADRDISPARKAEQRLKVCLQQFPKSSLSEAIQKRLAEVQENLADHDKMVGDEYFTKFYQHRANNLKGAQSRYLDVVNKYPFYSRRAEVLYRLGVTYMEEEEPDEATKYFQELVATHPNSKYADDAKEKLTAVGAKIPDTAKNAVQDEPEGPGFIQNIMQQVAGTVPRTVDKDGVIISRSSKGGDIIDVVIQNGGTLPDNYSRPDRIPPARNVTPLPPTPKSSAGEKKLSAEPTQPGPPPTGDNPTKPAATQTTMPATPPPSGTSGAKP
ncbi:MAG TPA: outer membrane protein assembly factor BamD [Pyrinomonadaceae bacterium]|nr:outer membrane protein assembly factor BamD [Pyrinomonadaceae bacterium]